MPVLNELVPRTAFRRFPRCSLAIGHYLSNRFQRPLEPAALSNHRATENHRNDEILGYHNSNADLRSMESGVKVCKPITMTAGVNFGHFVFHDKLGAPVSPPYLWGSGTPKNRDTRTPLVDENCRTARCHRVLAEGITLRLRGFETPGLCCHHTVVRFRHTR